jgi:hypothetical protein
MKMRIDRRILFSKGTRHGQRQQCPQKRNEEAEEGQEVTPRFIDRRKSAASELRFSLFVGIHEAGRQSRAQARSTTLAAK